MRMLKCYECGKTYDYDEDAFCSHCGAFNQPAHSSYFDADGNVVRVDGINEKNHAHSFVHEELHEENRKRAKLGLDQNLGNMKQLFRKPAAQPSANVKLPKSAAAVVFLSVLVVFWVFGILAAMLNLLW